MKKVKGYNGTWEYVSVYTIRDYWTVVKRGGKLKAKIEKGVFGSFTENTCKEQDKGFEAWKHTSPCGCKIDRTNILIASQGECSTKCCIIFYCVSRADSEYLRQRSFAVVENNSNWRL